MTSVSRSDQFAKVHKILKKHYKAAPVNSGRTVMEHLLFACCLEEAHHDAAEEAFAALVHTFFDWNEVRVTSMSELSEVMACLPDPRAAANRIKRVLHAVFEATFNFDLEAQRKKNLGPTIAWFEKLDGVTRFSVACVVQAALGGHSIPLDTGTMAALQVLDLATDKDAAAGVVPGLERAIPKSKGVEFGSLLHELGADYSANPYSPTLREILVQINPEVESRLPKRRIERPATPRPSAPPAKAAFEKPAKEPGGDKHSAAHAKPAASEKLAGKKKGQVSDPPPAQSAGERPKKKPAAAHHASAETSAEKSHAPEAGKKKSASEGLSKRKPR